MMNQWPVQNPNPHQPGWTQPAGAPYPIPQGWPGRPPHREPILPANEPGPWYWMDLVTVIVYVLLMFLGVGSFVLLIPGVPETITGILPGEQYGSAEIFAGEGLLPVSLAMNFMNYVVLVILTVIASWRALLSSFKTFRRFCPLKILAIPVLWITTLILNVLVSMLVGLPETSENQAALEEMTSIAPYWLMFFTVVIAGPLVEEYLFRHLLIGKLSRKLTLWATVPLSVLVFAFMHFVGSGEWNLQQLFPYVTMGLVFSLIYVFTKFSYAFAYVQHAFNNFMAISLLYLIPAEMLDADLAHALTLLTGPFGYFILNA